MNVIPKPSRSTRQPASPPHAPLMASSPRISQPPRLGRLAERTQSCREEAAKLGWEVREEFIAIDEGKSGNTLADREGFQFLIAHAKTLPRHFDYIMFSEQSRIGCNLTGVLSTAEILNALGVYFYFADTNLDSDGASFRFALARRALTDEIDRWSRMPKDMKCSCVGCEFFRVPVEASISALAEVQGLARLPSALRRSATLPKANPSALDPALLRRDLL